MSPTDDELYLNKRAEMAGDAKLWLEDPQGFPFQMIRRRLSPLPPGMKLRQRLALSRNSKLHQTENVS